MKNFIYGIVVGLSAGATATWFLAKRYFDKRQEEEFRKAFGDNSDAATTEKAEDVAPETNDVPTSNDNQPDLEKYSRIISEYNPEEKPAAKKTSKSAPKVISFDDYKNEENYMSENLKYYEEDDVLTDFDDRPINADMYLGEKGIEALGSATTDYIYIKNPKMKQVYEVEIIHGSLEED